MYVEIYDALATCEDRYLGMDLELSRKHTPQRSTLACSVVQPARL